MRIVVAYDIAGTDTPVGARRLRRVAKACARYGRRVQCSVFEAELGEADIKRLLLDVEHAMDISKDSIRVYRIRPGRDGDAMVLGVGEQYDPGGALIV